MEQRLFQVDTKTFILTNGPLILLNITANVFYACCLIFPLRGRPRLKQPLETLLRAIVFCSLTFCLSLAAMYWMFKFGSSLEMLTVLLMVELCTTHSSMACYVWLNFYYYLQIVSPQRALFLWIKRNVRSVVYVALAFDGLFFMFSSVATGASMVLDIHSAVTGNDTLTGFRLKVDSTARVCFILTQAHFLLCLCVMMLSSFSTAHYLHRHMRSMAQSGSCCTTPNFHSQMTVTITGILQGIFYFIYYAFYLVDSFLYAFTQRCTFSLFISFTIASVYITGTTVNLGTGQAAFRQRTADVWRALKALCGAGTVTNDVDPHCSQLTS